MQEGTVPTYLPHQKEFVDVTCSGTSVHSTAHLLNKSEVLSVEQEEIKSHEEERHMLVT